jgi:hypothetical protein
LVAPTPAIPTFTDGLIVTQTNLNGLGTNLKNLYSYLMGGFRTFKPICSVTTTADQSVTTSADGVISWDKDSIDTDNMWVATGKDHMTINTAGLYQLQLQVHWGTDNATNLRAAKILVNGTNPTTNAVAADAVPAFTIGEGPVNNCSALVALNAGSSIYANRFQDSGATIPVKTVFGGCHMSAEWISPIPTST